MFQISTVNIISGPQYTTFLIWLQPVCSWFSIIYLSSDLLSETHRSNCLWDASSKIPLRYLKQDMLNIVFHLLHPSPTLPSPFHVWENSVTCPAYWMGYHTIILCSPSSPVTIMSLAMNHSRFYFLINRYYPLFCLHYLQFGLLNFSLNPGGSCLILFCKESFFPQFLLMPWREPPTGHIVSIRAKELPWKSHCQLENIRVI